jgi:Helix-turn-helix.
MDNISEFLTAEMNKVGMNQSDLARKSGVSTGQISRLINGTRGVGEKSLRAIAEALSVPPDVMFRVAGFLPPAPAKTEQTERLLYLFNLMDARQKEILLSQANWILQEKP